MQPQCLVVLAFAFVASPAFADILTVHPDGSGDFPTIQAAIDASVDGDVVVLTAGEFQGEGNRALKWRGKAITVRGETGNAADVTIESENDYQYGPGRAMIFNEGEGPDTRLEDVTVYGGYGAGEDPGTVECQGTSPTFSGCVFSYGFGITVHCSGGEPTFVDCEWRGNHVVQLSGSPGLTASAAILRGCRFEGNWNDDVCGAASIGHATISDCIFTDNTTDLFGGSLCIGQGSVVEDSSISGGAQYYGAAVVVSGPSVFRRCSISGFGSAISAMDISGCVTLQECYVESISPPDACVRRVIGKGEPAGGEPLALSPESWGRIKSGYR